MNSYAKVDESILFDGVDIGRHARVRRAIIDKGVCIPPGFDVGYDHDQDRRRGFTVTENGVTVIAKTDGIEHFLPEGERTEILPQFRRIGAPPVAARGLTAAAGCHGRLVCVASPSPRRRTRFRQFPHGSFVDRRGSAGDYFARGCARS